MHKKNHNNLYIYIAIFCFIVMATCYAYGVHLGLNSRLTAGGEVDMSNISIALSRIWFGLHEGYIGYQQIHTALYQILVPDGNANNSANWAILNDPLAIQQAFDNVRKLLPKSLPSYSMFSSNFISINMEDPGLADFYTLAFLLFGVHPTSMYNTYFLLLSLSVALFIIEYRQQLLPLIFLGLIIGVFPIFFFSNFFNLNIASVNSNRFMSTLGFVPIGYILCIYFKSTQKINPMQLLRLICQSLLFVFALTIRRSGNWQLIALILFAFSIVIKLYWPYRKNLFVLDHLRFITYPLLTSILIFIGIIAIYIKIQTMMMNPIYRTDCAPSGHALWHSAFLGMSTHPDWEKLNPGKGITMYGGDANGWHTFEKYMRERGLDPICHITNGYYLGLHEMVMRQEVLEFVYKHKVFALELYGYYKPKKLIYTLWERISNISWICLLYCISLSIGAGLLFTKISETEKPQPSKIMKVSTLFLIISWLPAIFAYPINYNGDDFWMAAIYLSLCISLLTYYLMKKWNKSHQINN